MLKNLSLSIASVLVFFTVLESSLRIAGYTSLEMYDTDSKRIWKLKPNQNTYTKVFKKPVYINSKGFRDNEFDIHKSKDVFRIFSFGNSTTYGWGVGQNEPYHQVAEQRLNLLGLEKRIEWINAGVIGYCLYQELLAFKDCLKYEPDMVTIATTGNEAWNFELFSESEIRNRERMVIVKNFLRQFATYNFVAELKAARVYYGLRDRLLTSELHGGRELAGSTGKSDTQSDGRLERYRSHVKEIIQTCRVRKIKLIFLLLESSSPRREIIIEEAKAAGIDLIDFAPVMSDENNIIKKSDLGIYDSHPTAHGHQLMGDILVDYMVKNIFTETQKVEVGR